MSEVIVTIGEEGTAPVVIITPGETILSTASVQVQTQDETPIVHIHVDENSAQSAADSAAAAQAALEALQNTSIAGCIEKAEFAEFPMTGDAYAQFSIPQYSSIRFIADSTIFKGVYIFPGYKAYSGKKLTLKNFQDTDILLMHLDSDVLLNTPLYFSNEQDYILKPGKIIEFSLSLLTNRFEFIGDSEDISGKEDKSNKGAANGYVPLDEAIKIASEYLNIVNDLVTGGATNLLSGEQGKQLKFEIDAINTLLTSNDINLDTVQELVDAIKTVQTSLSTILVNDLTTGGTTKALTAEMGKTLKSLYDSLSTGKVDKAAGYSLTKNDLTDLLKAAYDDAVTKAISAYNWITTNGATILAHLLRTDNPHSVTKSQVGLSDVDNVSSSTIIASANSYTDGQVSGKENSSNKSTSIIADYLSNVKFPSVKAVYDWVVSLLSGKHDISNQIEVSGNQTADASWHGKEVTFLTSGLLTIPATLPDQFNFDLATDAGVTVTWAITSPKTWLYGAPTTMTEKQICTVSQRTNTNSIRVRGL